MPSLIVRKDQPHLRRRVLEGQTQLLSFRQSNIRVLTQVSILASGENKKRIALSEGRCNRVEPVTFIPVEPHQRGAAQGPYAIFKHFRKERLGPAAELQLAIENGLRSREELFAEADYYRAHTYHDTSQGLPGLIIHWKPDRHDDPIDPMETESVESLQEWIADLRNQIATIEDHLAARLAAAPDPEKESAG